MLGSLASHYKFSLDKPFNELPADKQKFILHGSGSQSVDFKYLNDRGDNVKRSHPLEGIVPHLERRYSETQSASVRAEQIGRATSRGRVGQYVSVSVVADPSKKQIRYRTA